MPKLLDLLTLKGCIVTADALNCQRVIAAEVIEQGGGYVLALKGNQGSLHDDVRLFLDNPQRPAGTTVSTEKACYLLSTTPTAERFSEIVRAHWEIENSLHGALDVTMNEDQTRNRLDHGPQNLALLRRLALNLAKLEGSKGSMEGKLKQAGWNDAFLTSLLAQFGKTQMR